MKTNETVSQTLGQAVFRSGQVHPGLGFLTEYFVAASRGVRSRFDRELRVTNPIRVTVQKSVRRIFRDEMFRL
jgi:hypothetical protein